jgi:hypothetical protein
MSYSHVRIMCDIVTITQMAMNMAVRYYHRCLILVEPILVSFDKSKHPIILSFLATCLHNMQDLLEAGGLRLLDEPSLQLINQATIRVT